MGLFGPRFEKGATVQRTDDARFGTVQAEQWGDYIAVTWPDGATSWTRCSVLRLVECENGT
jgi:hypothetical protein